MNVMRTGWHPLTRANTAVTKSPTPLDRAQPSPPRCQLLRSLLGGKEVCGGPEEFQHGFVTPVDLLLGRIHHHVLACVGRKGGEAAVPATPGQKQEKMWIGLEKFQRHGALGVASDGVVLGAYAQNWDSYFINIS